MVYSLNSFNIEVMNLQRIICVLYLSLCTLLSLSAQTQVIGKTPQIKPDYAQGVSGHAATLLTHGAKQVLLMLGGCNFPDKPALDGGAKRYYREVYATDYRHGRVIKKWRLLGEMPDAFAYAAYQTYQNSLLVIGGKSEGYDLKTAYRLSLNKQGELITERLPDLPEVRSGMASVLIGSRLYLIGGSVSGRLSNSMISLDLDNLVAGWQEESPYPNAPYLKVLATKQGVSGEERILLVGAFRYAEGVEPSVETHQRVMRYDLDTRAWHSYEYLDYENNFEGYTLGGASSYTLQDGRVTWVGGVSEAIFLPALQREQALRRATQEGDEALVARLKAEAKDYLSQAPEYYRFCPVLFFANVGGTGELVVSQTLEPSPHLAKADAALVEVRPDHFILLGGETKPGIRTADIVY